MIERGSFIFYRSFKESLEDLSDSDKLIMYEAISDYALDRIEPNLTGFPSALFKLIRPQLDANWQRYENGKKGANHGNKGGAPKGNKNAAKEKQPKNNLKNNLNKTGDKTGEKTGEKTGGFRANEDAFLSSQYVDKQHINESSTAKQPLNNGKTTPNVNVNLNYNDNVNLNIESDWRKSFELYQEYVREGYQEVLNDKEWMNKQQEYNPSVDIPKSIEKSCVNFWATEEGWANKKKSKAKTINWKTTFGNAISNKINKVYKDNKEYEDTRASQFGL